MKLLLSVSCSILIWVAVLLNPNHLSAVENPLDTANNFVGIHISTEADIEDAAKLVNGNGAAWGYVTLVIPAYDRDLEKWQRIFDLLREKQLIPLVRIATQPEGAIWTKAYEHQIAEWVGFLNKLNWVTKNRYVLLFNEPNHSKEWGGSIDPVDFAKVSIAFRNELKKTSEDFFVLPGALDLAPGNTANTMHPASFYQRIYDEVPEYFTSFDGWNSHAYANPAFSGRPEDTGRLSIVGYQWERNLVQQYGAAKDLPWFITETGWRHSQGKNINQSYHSPETVAEFFETAFTNIWAKDPQIVAVTPFILNYQASPFDYFSWKEVDSDNYHAMFAKIAALPKVSGKPVQQYDAEVITDFFPSTITSVDEYQVVLSVKNTGQSIWEPKQVVAVVSDKQNVVKKVGDIPFTKPGEIAKIPLTLQSESAGPAYFEIQLLYEGQRFGQIFQASLEVSSPANIFTPMQLWIQRWLHPDTFLSLVNTYRA